MKNIVLSILLMLPVVTFGAPQQASPTLVTNTPITQSQMNQNFTDLANVANAAILKSISVLDFGAISNCLSCDNATSFNAALAANNTYGSYLKIPNGIWTTNSVVNNLTQTSILQIEPLATFSGSTSFPRTLLGSNIQPISHQANYIPNTTRPSLGGYTGVSHEFTQIAGITGNDSTFHIGGWAKSSSNSAAGGLSTLEVFSKSDSATNGYLNGIKILHQNNSTSTTDAALNILGSGTTNSDAGIIISHSSNNFTSGIAINNSLTGITVTPTTTVGVNPIGINVSSPTVDNTISHGLVIGQVSNGGNLITAVKTAGGTLGNLINFTDSTGVTSTTKIDFNGNLFTNGTLVTKGTGYTGVANSLTLGTDTATTATFGAASALPATPAGYLVIYIGTTKYKIPYYNN